DYTIGMVVDPNNRLTESNEIDNFNVALGRDKANVAIAGTETLELVGTNFTSSGTFAAGQRLNVSFTVENLGNRTFPANFALPIRFVLSPDTTINNNDVVVGVRYAGAVDDDFGPLINILPTAQNPSVLGARGSSTASRTFQFELQLPDSSSSIWSATRPFYLSAWIDPSGDITQEVDASNNKLDETTMNATLGKIYLRFN
ncbi:hypothetical protein IQ250_21110, partial [Pseudanabaenaceae cyanobacterium LEGE 13415]|nr:hypothetical protein [Pseudanabaenaceae cyanobacterium LEGE 13415]